MNDRGRNSGVTGAVDVQGGPSFTGSVYAWKRRRDANIRNIRPREQNWFLPRSLGEGATLLISFTVRVDGYFEPSTLENATGTVTTTLHTGRTVAYSVRFTSCWLEFNEKDDKWYGTVGASVVSAPTTTWAGTQTTTSAPGSVTENETPDGVTVKTLDPNNLVEQSTVVLDLYGLADTDAAEVTRIESYFNRAVPVTGHKIRSISLTRQGRWGAVITITHGLTNTEDDIEMPGTVYDVDSAHSDAGYIFGKAQLRIVQDNATISWPTTPTQPADLKQGTVSKQQLHDGKWALTYNFVRNNSEDAIEVDGTWTRRDRDGLGDTARITVVTNSETVPLTPAAPTGQQFYESTTRPLTVANGSYTGYWVHTFDYATTTRTQQIEFDADIVVDPANINDRQTIKDVTDSGTPPATPTPNNTDLKLVLRRTRRLQDETETWLHVFEFGRNNSEDDREHTQRTVDPDSLGFSEIIPILHTSGSSSPGTPAQVGTSSVLVETSVQRVCVANGSFTGLWLWTFRFGTLTRLQELEFQGVALVDPSTIENNETVFDVTSSSTPPSTPTPGNDLKHTGTRSRRIAGTPERWLHIFEFARNNAEDRIEVSNTVTVIDPNDIDEGGTVGVVHTSATPPSTPSAPGGVLTKTRVRPLVVASGSFTGLWLHVFEYGPLTDLNRREYAGVFKNDQSDLRDVESVVDVTTSSTTPATPTPSDADLKLIGVDRQRFQNTPEMWQHTFYFGRNNAEDEVETRGTFTITNTDDLLEEAAITLVTNSATPPADPGTPNSAVLDDIKTDPITVANGSYVGRWSHTFVYRPNTRKQAIERGGTSTTVDDVGRERDTTTTIETFATSLDSMRGTLRTSNLNDPTFIDASLRRLDATHVAQRIERISNDIIVADNIQIEYQNRSSFAGQVQVSEIRQRDTGEWQCYVNSVGLYVKTGTVVLRRRWTNATALTQSATQTAYFFRLLLGTTNVNEFLGYEIGSLMYRGWRNVRNYGYESTPTSHVVVVDHIFEYASPVGWYNDSQVALGWRDVPLSVTVGFNPPSRFGWTITPNGNGNFSLFTA